jgi:hypothetical protein
MRNIFLLRQEGFKSDIPVQLAVHNRHPALRTGGCFPNNRAAGPLTFDIENHLGQAL